MDVAVDMGLPRGKLRQVIFKKGRDRMFPTLCQGQQGVKYGWVCRIFTQESDGINKGRRVNGGLSAMVNEMVQNRRKALGIGVLPCIPFCIKKRRRIYACRLAIVHEVHIRAVLIAEGLPDVFCIVRQGKKAFNTEGNILLCMHGYYEM